MREVSGQMCVLDCDKWSKRADKDKHCARMSEAREWGLEANIGLTFPQMSKRLFVDCRKK